MGKSSRKEKKRRRNSSRDRLTVLENKVERVLGLLSQREVKSPGRPRSSTSILTTEIQDNLGSCSDSESIRSVSAGASQASSEGQVLPADQMNSGVSNLSVRSSSPTPHKRVRLEEGPSTNVEEEAAEPLTKELFGSDLVQEELAPWNELVTHRWRDLARKGLPAEQRDPLLKKYAPGEAVAFLKAPMLNQECKVALKNNSIVKRDNYNNMNQNQVGAALCALGEAISDFLRPDTQRSLCPEARLAVAKVNEGAQILADLHYRLSLARRAQIAPTLNLTAKATIDTIPVDDFLFGASFGEEIKKVASMEKSSRDIIKAPLTISKRVQQPLKQPAQVASARPGNSRAPVRSSRSVWRRTGVTSDRRRSTYRSRSHSRRR
ncbi:uncharacterized protein LOC120359642 [Solenopsis invicta]|uniref:uncharacterized protein LOC120359642 n=1 Tax=Solenopsis invicta TaxID=13686 RepID=UPI00193D2241|nr:uncharacterized protein LOC120359642 [Solenopsis invicta]